MELILIRHGLPVRSAETSDPPLSPEGHEQSRRVGARLARETIHAVLSSTMKRAVETAQPLAAHTGQTIATHDGICEFDRDAGSYTPMEELKSQDYEAWKRFVARGRQGANIVDFQRTVVDTLESVIAAHKGERVAVFCHGGVINAWTAHVLGMEPKLFFEPKYTSIHRYLCAGTGERNLLSLNDIAHLETPA